MHDRNAQPATSKLGTVSTWQATCNIVSYICKLHIIRLLMVRAKIIEPLHTYKTFL